MLAKTFGIRSIEGRKPAPPAKARLAPTAKQKSSTAKSRKTSQAEEIVLNSWSKVDKQSRKSTVLAGRGLARGATTKSHSDLQSFIQHGRDKKLDPNSTTYRGTHFEYTVIEALKPYNFELQRCGSVGDKGTDLYGTWWLPEEPKALKVIIQCKASKVRPPMMRELSGAFHRAPPGYRGNDVMAILVTSGNPTDGVRDALSENEEDLMGLMKITKEGAVLEFQWNDVAQMSRLTGMEVARTYGLARGHGLCGPASDVGRVKSTASLWWRGKFWRGTTPANQADLGKGAALIQTSVLVGNRGDGI